MDCLCTIFNEKLIIYPSTWPYTPAKVSYRRWILGNKNNILYQEVWIGLPTDYGPKGNTSRGISGPKNDQVSNNISSQKVMAPQPTISPAKKTGVSAAPKMIRCLIIFWKTYRRCLPSSQNVLAAKPTIYSAKKVMAAKPTISPAKKLWQLNQQYIQPKSYGS